MKNFRRSKQIVIKIFNRYFLQREKAQNRYRSHHSTNPTQIKLNYSLGTNYALQEDGISFIFLTRRNNDMKILFVLLLLTLSSSAFAVETCGKVSEIKFNGVEGGVYLSSGASLGLPQVLGGVSMDTVINLASQRRRRTSMRRR